MQAILFDEYGGPDVLRLATIPAPEPGPGQVGIELRAASVIPADWKLRAGLRGCTASRARENIVPLPPNLDFAEGAALMHAGICAWICLVETAQLASSMRVLVHGGAGAIGGLAVQLAHHIGTHVMATCRADNIAYVREMGADEVVAYDRDDFAAVTRDFDVVLDLIGGDVHARSYRVLKPNGHMVCLIAAPFEDRGAEFGVRVTTPRIHDRRSALDVVADPAARGVLRPRICGRLGLAQAAEAHRLMEANTVTRGRIVLDIPPL